MKYHHDTQEPATLTEAERLELLDRMAPTVDLWERTVARVPADRVRRALTRLAEAILNDPTNDPDAVVEIAGILRGDGQASATCDCVQRESDLTVWGNHYCHAILGRIEPSRVRVFTRRGEHDPLITTDIEDFKQADPTTERSPADQNTCYECWRHPDVGLCRRHRPSTVLEGTDGSESSTSDA